MLLLEKKFTKKEWSKIPKKGGQAMIISVVFFLLASVMLSAGVFLSVLNNVENATHLIHSKQSYAYAEGLLEDVSYRIMQGMNVDSSESLYDSEGKIVATSTITEVGDFKNVSVRGDVNQNIRKINGIFAEGDGVSFNYGVQSGEGGIVLENSSLVTGNIYSNGPVVGSDNIIKGDVVSAGPFGLVDGIHATGTVYANTIKDSDIEGDAYYSEENIYNTIVGGVLYPNSEDQATSSMPISDELIDKWEQEAEDVLVISSPCPYEITSDTTIGPVKIACDLEISGSTIVTIAGGVWVKGDITMNNKTSVVVDESLGSQSLPIIADNPDDRENSGIITMKNQTSFSGSGSNGSYVLLVSQNSSAENGGEVKAIKLLNTGTGDLLLYAPHGEILLENNTSLKEVTAYRVRLRNSTEVIYESGLANTLFTSGPSGGFSIEGWGEVK